jgi:mRNA interferase RelE/StbE
MPSLSLTIEKQAIEFLASLPPKQYKQVQTAVYRLMGDPKPHDAKPLKGEKFKGLWRCTVGEYRIVYRFTDTTIKVNMIDKRNDDEIYKHLERTL